ncbi:hypothetical protein CDCA_CDCA16G4146 [Cyanidium caldarium]|uniref:Uncharacterized protein n=1 Tax=Cyanidium caldarium TaxID=2771 RepID=A0AAV9J1G8_CYACA|nr:hypothetical protein CDCA_CDCA16G4146 [Cyanidium caldarium]
MPPKKRKAVAAAAAETSTEPRAVAAPQTDGTLDRRVLERLKWTARAVRTVREWLGVREAVDVSDTSRAAEVEEGVADVQDCVNRLQQLADAWGGSHPDDAERARREVAQVLGDCLAGCARQLASEHRHQQEKVGAWPDRLNILVKALIAAGVLDRPVLWTQWEPALLETCHLLPESEPTVDTWTKRVRRTHTRHLYTQHVYNLLREAPDGYAQLVLFLAEVLRWTSRSTAPGAAASPHATCGYQPPESAEAAWRTVTLLMGRFCLEVNRCIDLLLQALVSEMQHTAAAGPTYATAASATDSNDERGVPGANEALDAAAVHPVVRAVWRHRGFRLIIDMLSRLPRANLVQVLGFRLQQRQQQQQQQQSLEEAPDTRIRSSAQSTYRVTALLIVLRVVRLREVWPHLLPADELPSECLPPSRISDAVQHTAATVDLDVHTRDRWDALQTQLSEWSRSVGRVNLAGSSSTAASRRPSAPVTFVSSTEAWPSPSLATLWAHLAGGTVLRPDVGKLGVLAALVEVNAWPLVQRWMGARWGDGQVAHARVRLACACWPLREALLQYVDRQVPPLFDEDAWISLECRAVLERAGGAVGGVARGAPTASISASALVSLGAYLGGNIAQRPQLLHRVLVGAMDLAPVWRRQLVQQVLLPAWLASHGEPTVARRLCFHRCSPLTAWPWRERYAAYVQFERGEDASGTAVLQTCLHALHRTAVRRQLRRLSADNVTDIARTLTPALLSDPWSVARVMSDTARSYENLIPVMAAALAERVPPFTAADASASASSASAAWVDVFAAVLLDELSVMDRPRWKGDGSGVAAWWSNLVEWVVAFAEQVAGRVHVPETAAPTVGDDLLDALLHMVMRRLLAAEVAFAPLLQRLLERLGDTAPWNDEMMSEEELRQARRQYQSPETTESDATESAGAGRLRQALQRTRLAVPLVMTLAQCRQQLLGQPAVFRRHSLRTVLHASDLLQSATVQLLWFVRRCLARTTALEEREAVLGALPAPTDLVQRHRLSVDTVWRLVSLRRVGADDEPLDAESVLQVMHLAQEPPIAADGKHRVTATPLPHCLSPTFLDCFWWQSHVPDTVRPEWFRVAPSASDAVDATRASADALLRMERVTDAVLEWCVWPRLTAAPFEYLYCLEWVQRLAAAPDVSPLNILLLLTRLFKGAFATLQSATRSESVRLARLLRGALQLVRQWHQAGAEAWQAERGPRPSFYTQAGTRCEWSQFVRWMEWMQERMVQAAVATMRVEMAGGEASATAVVNALTALSVLVDVFPLEGMAGADAERLQQAVGEWVVEGGNARVAEVGAREDIIALATSYLGRLRARFRVGNGVPARTVSSSSSRSPRPTAGRPRHRHPPSS